MGCVVSLNFHIVVVACISIVGLFLWVSLVALPGLWAGFMFWPVCLLLCLVAPFVGFGFGGCIELMPFPYVLWEVLCVCCLLWLPFRLGVLLQIVCLAIGLFLVINS